MNLRSLLLQPLLTVVFHGREVRWTLGRAGRIAAHGREPLPLGMIDDGVIVDALAVGLCLRDTPDFPRGRRLQVISALPAQRAVLRQLELPSLPKRQFVELVQREVRREVPMPAHNAHVTWTPVGERDGRTAVFVVGIARDVLDSHIATLRAAGLRPQAIDLRLVAAARAVGGRDAIIANVERDEIELGIFRDGVPAILRFVPLSMADGDERWQSQVAEELARTIKFYRDSHREDDAVDRMPITLVGGAASLASEADLIGATGHDARVARLRLALDGGADALAFAANAGLVLKEAA